MALSWLAPKIRRRSALPAAGRGTRCRSDAQGHQYSVSPSPRTANETPATCRKFRDRLGGLLSHGPRTHRHTPTQNSHSTSARDSTSTPTWRTSNGSARPYSIRFVAFTPQPWVPRTSPKLRNSPGQLGRELGLDQRLVPTQVEDVIDVLDVDRALLDAGTARRAGPQHFWVQTTPLCSASADERPIGFCDCSGGDPSVSCSGVARSSPARSLPPPASRYGALA